MLTAFISFLWLCGCEAQPDPTEFSESALSDQFISLEGHTVLFSDILKEHQGKTIFIDVWAGWCRDCIVGFPKLKKLQAEKKDVVFLYLSLDKSEKEWKQAIEKYQLDGTHYFMSSGWEGPLGEFLDLDWIPRYIVVDTSGSIEVFKAVKVDDPNLMIAL